VGARDALKAAILGGASILGVKAGRLLEGYEADLAILDASDPGLQPLSAYNLESSLVYAASSRDVAYTIVAGRIVYSPEHEERYREEARRIGRRLADFVESIK
jgi:5-methylthioadenosine/S-adenosylhomocysteine deaminase